MTALRRSNAAQIRRMSDEKSSTTARQSAGSIRGTIKGYIVGIALIVCAVAMVASLVVPSGAIVTRTMAWLLRLCFGRGAILFPTALVVFALGFFFEEGGPISKRSIVGMSMIILAILGLLSINMPLVESHPEAVVNPPVVELYGGYVGGALAWLLLVSVGRAVGNIILAGVIIVGAVVGDFSVLRLAGRVRETVRGVREARSVAHERRMDQVGAYGTGTPTPVKEEDPAPTTFLGARKTTVLRRDLEAEDDSAEASEPLRERASGPLGLLGRLRHRDGGETAPAPADVAPPLDATRVRDAPVEAARAGSIPSFLEEAARGRSSKRSKARRRDPIHKDGGSAQRESRRAATAAMPTARPGDAAEDFELPPFSMLSSNPNSASSASSKDELDHTMARLQGTLEEFGLTSKVVDYISGPLVTTFRVEMGEGERVNKIRTLEDDIALTLAAEKVRIFAPIPGTSFVGIEIPNKTRQNVHLGDVLPYATGGSLEVAVGRDSAGKPVIADISKMPHMLVAGTTGSGKSVMINSMIMSLLMRTTPSQVRLIMIDPKRVEFSAYNGLPHLYAPVVTEPRQAASALSWAVSEMERRLKVFQKAGARDVRVYNRMCSSGKLAEMDNPPQPMPLLVVIIDELSDLMMVAGKDVEASIVRIAQLARAAGIHLVIATQRPSANVVTGLIKSNIDSRVALKVSSGIDSRVILDETGAERLLGNGDMLFKDRGLTPRRVLGCYTSDNEINSVVEFIRSQAEPDYHEEILSQVVPGQPGAQGGAGADPDDPYDPLIWEAAQIVVDSQLGSTSGLQRRLKVGYARAGRIMDMLETKGVVGPPDGSRPREVLLDTEGLEELRSQEEAYRGV